MSINDRLTQHLKRGRVGFPTARQHHWPDHGQRVDSHRNHGLRYRQQRLRGGHADCSVDDAGPGDHIRQADLILPTTGSVYDYINCGMGRFFAITGTLLAYLIVHVFAGSAETILSGVMALVNFEHLNTLAKSAGSPWLLGGVVFGILNAFGVSAFGLAEIIQTFGMWTILRVFGVLGLMAVPAVKLEGWFGVSLVGTDLITILSLVGMAMFMLVGRELPGLIQAAVQEVHVHRGQGLAGQGTALEALLGLFAVRHALGHGGERRHGGIQRQADRPGLGVTRWRGRWPSRACAPALISS